MKKFLAILLSVVMMVSVLAVTAVADEENVALNKTYTASEQFRQGSNWGWDENADIVYPDTNGVELTDGVYADGSDYKLDEWAGWSGKTPSVMDGVGYNWVIIDLEANYDISKCVAVFGKFGDGINPPTKIEVFVSDDGETWGDEAVAYVEPAVEELGVHKAELVGEATGRYVQFRIHSGGWAFLTELEVYGVEATEGGNDTEGEGSEGEGSEGEDEPTEPVLKGDILIDAVNAASWDGGAAVYGPILVYGTENTVSGYIGGVWNGWWYKITAEYDAETKSFTVIEVLPNDGDQTYAEKTLEEGQIMILVYPGPEANLLDTVATAGAVAVGDTLVATGFDFQNESVADIVTAEGEGFASPVYFTVYSGAVSDDEPSDPSEPSEPTEPEVSLEDELKEFVGEASADAKFDLEINAPETYKAGDEITVTVTVKNITAENGLHVVNFNLYYDNEKLVLTNDLDEEEDNRLLCIDDANLPSKWENFTKVNNDFDPANEEGTEVKALNDGVIFASALTDKDTASTAIKEDGAVVFTFTFTAVEDAEGDIGIAIPNAEVEGALNNAAGAEKYAGNGGYAIIAGEADEDVSEDVSGDVSEDSSEDSSKEDVVPGDASSMIVFAIIALVAIAGSAVVIKSRR